MMPSVSDLMDLSTTLKRWRKWFMTCQSEVWNRWKEHEVTAMQDTGLLCTLSTCGTLISNRTREHWYQWGTSYNFILTQSTRITLLSKTKTVKRAKKGELCLYENWARKVMDTLKPWAKYVFLCWIFWYRVKAHLIWK